MAKQLVCSAIEKTESTNHQGSFAIQRAPISRRKLMLATAVSAVCGLPNAVNADPLANGKSGWTTGERKDLAVGKAVVFSFERPWILQGPNNTDPNRTVKYFSPIDPGAGPILTLYVNDQNQVELWLQCRLNSGIRVAPKMTAFYTDTNKTTVGIYTSNVSMSNFHLHTKESCNEITSVDFKHSWVDVKNKLDHPIRPWFEKVIACDVTWSGPAADCNW